MTHNSILNNFSFRFLVRAINEELGQIVFKAKCYQHLKTTEDELNYILKRLMPRWNVMFNSNAFSELYKANTYITIATYLNKYGYQDDYITQKAIEGLAKIKNDDFGFLPSHQYKKAAQAIAFLKAPVTYHKRKPQIKATVTQYRKGDLFAIHFNGYYCAGIINSVEDIYERVSVLTYEKVFENEPNINELKNVPFLKNKHSIVNLNYIIDPAGQFKLLDNIPWKTQQHSFIISDIDDYLTDLKMSTLN